MNPKELLTLSFNDAKFFDLESVAKLQRNQQFGSYPNKISNEQTLLKPLLSIYSLEPYPI